MTTQRGVLALLAAIVGAAVMAFSFVYGISAALDGSGSGAGPYPVLFLIGAALVIAALVVSVVRLVRGAPKALPVATIVVALLPTAGVIIAASAARG
jgi:hypothetical protein